MLGSMAKSISITVRFLISEHGILHQRARGGADQGKLGQRCLQNIWIEQFKKMSLLAYQKADTVTCLYERAKLLSRSIFGCPPEKIRVTPNGINMANLTDIPGKPGRMSSGSMPEQCCVSHLIKDVKTMIQAFAFAERESSESETVDHGTNG